MKATETYPIFEDEKFSAYKRNGVVICVARVRLVRRRRRSSGRSFHWIVRLLRPWLGGAGVHVRVFWPVVGVSRPVRSGVGGGLWHRPRVVIGRSSRMLISPVAALRVV